MSDPLPPPDSRRYRALAIDPDSLLGVLRRAGPDNGHEFMAVPTIDLPEGCRVVAVNYEPMRAAFVAIVEHESFDPVPVGHWVPTIEPTYTVVRLPRATPGPDPEG